MADQTPTMIPSRRKLLMSVPVAIAATALPVAAIALPLLDEDDARFRQLANQLVPLAAEVRRAWAIDKADRDRFEAGLAPLVKVDKPSGNIMSSSYHHNPEYWDKRFQVIEEHPELHNPELGHRPWDVLHEELYTVADEILEFDVDAPEDLAIQVLAYMTAYDHVCQEYDELHGFFRSLCSFLKVPLPTIETQA